VLEASAGTGKTFTRVKAASVATAVITPAGVVIPDVALGGLVT